MGQEIFSPRIGTWVWDVQPNKLFGDTLISTYFGMDAAEGAAGQPLERFLCAIHPDDRNRVERSFRDACYTGKNYSEAYRVRTLHGDERLVLAEGRCYNDARGRPNIYPGHVVDIGDMVGPDPSIVDLQDHLHVALLKARQLRLGLAQHLLSMAILEVSDVRRTTEEMASRLN